MVSTNPHGLNLFFYLYWTFKVTAKIQIQTKTNLKIEIKLNNLYFDSALRIDVENEYNIHTRQIECNKISRYLQRPEYDIFRAIVEYIVHWQIDQNIPIRATNPNVTLFRLLWGAN